MKKIFSYLAITVMTLSGAGCSDFLDQKNPAYSANGFFKTEAGLREGVTGCYTMMLGRQHWNTPTCVVIDNYSPYGMDMFENNSLSDGNAIEPGCEWIGYYYQRRYNAIARCNSVIAGAQDAIDGMSDDAKRYFAECRAIRCYEYYNLIAAFGDIPFFTAPVTIDDYTASRTDKKEVVEWIISELDAIKEELPWQPAQRGRITRGFVLGLKARTCLFAGSFNINDDANRYFRLSAEAAKEVIDSKEYALAGNFIDLYTMPGQAKPDVQKDLILELMFTPDGSYPSFSWVVYSATILSGYGSDAVRYPSNLLADVFECKDGKRIDQSPLYNPRKPLENRDPRMRFTLTGHGDTCQYTDDGGATIKKVILNVYDAKTKVHNGKRWTPVDNFDATGSRTLNTCCIRGVGYAWRKYAEDVSHDLQYARMNLIAMRYSEILLTYAEAKIELDEMDETVYEAINSVRRRVKMPDISTDRYGKQDLMRQIVRRERKVEMAGEGLLFTDFRRWDIGDLLNKYPRYAFPLKEYDGKTLKFAGLETTDVPKFDWDTRADINDVPSYEHYKAKLNVRCKDAHWKPQYRFWPIPRSETQRDPNLTNPGYE